MRYDSADTTGIDRLLKLVEQRAGHWLAIEVEGAKIALTEAERHVIDCARIEPGLSAALDRAQFLDAPDPNEGL